MRPLNTDVLRELIADDEPPCISLYQPTHPTYPEAEQDLIRYTNLLRQAERSLQEKYSTREVRPLLEPFQALADNRQFWTSRRAGLAVLASPSRFDVFRFYRPVREFVEVATTFHVKPLLRMLQSADDFHVLCLDRSQAKLFEGNRDTLAEVDTDDMPTDIKAALGDQLTEAHRRIAYSAEPTVFHGQGSRREEADKDTERFFQVIDREVLERYSRPIGLPLILVALPENQAIFRKITRNTFLQPEGVAKHPESLAREELRAEVWRVVEPKYLNRLAQLTDEHRAAEAKGMAASKLEEVAQAAAAARIALLMVEAERVIPGQSDPATGQILPGRLADPEVGDAIDDLAEHVIRTGGEVVVVPAARMPVDTGVAATFRH